MKILASDYDGTLNFGGITDEKIEYIKNWQKAGNLFTVVSGRQREFVFQLIEDGIPIDYLIACNGAVITDSTGKTVYEKRCNEPIALTLIEYIFSLNCEFVYVCEDCSYKIEQGCEIKEISSFCQISTACEDETEAYRIVEILKEDFSSFVDIYQNGDCIDIVPKGVSKAMGIYQLLALVNAKKEDVISVGDNINDLPMLNEFYSYAMQNGTDKIKEVCDNITKDIADLIKREMTNS